jgi:hypothetical protein
MRRAILVAVGLLCTVALTGCSDVNADHSACKAKAYEVFKVSLWKSDDALDYVRVCMISAGYKVTDICFREIQAGGYPLSHAGYMAHCFERPWWNGWRRVGS